MRPGEFAAPADARIVAQRAKAAARGLARLSEEQRQAALKAMGDAVQHAADALLTANEGDMARAESSQAGEALSPATMSRLRLTGAKLSEMVEQIRSVALLPNPLGRVLEAIELDDKAPKASRESRGLPDGTEEVTPGLRLQKISVPLGVLLVIFEARPDAVTQIAALALKSGNAVVLKAGREVEGTAAALVDVLRAALRAQGVAEDAVSLVTGREQVAELLRANDLIDMVIPRGSKQLVEYVQANTRIPVLGHSEGVCHIYVDREADQELALRVIADAKLDYPAACNAVETVLVHREIAQEFVPKLLRTMQERSVLMHGDAEVRGMASPQERAKVASVQDWHTEFGEPELSVGIVTTMEQAIEHIHRYGSAHTESILTEDLEAAEQFLREVDAAGVYHNASTRFADGFRYGFGAEVGISTSKLHARGPVGLEGLTTYKYVLRGAGHVAGDYRGKDGRAFTHRRA